jgi:4-methyl-5(b-hydroxyethyl)-thiazole monophosphate biosynthesis
MTTHASVLVCLAPGSEETEAVTTIDLLVRAGINVITASVTEDGSREIVCSRGVRLLADVPLVQVADNEFEAIVLPGGLKGAECFRDSPLLIETVRQFHLSGRIVAAICAVPGIVLIPHNLFPSQAPGTATDFALKLIELLVSKEKACEVGEQWVLAAGIYDYSE